jgi:hypothetical protein
MTRYRRLKDQHMHRLTLAIALAATMFGLVACDSQTAPSQGPGSIQVHMNGQVGTTIGVR